MRPAFAFGPFFLAAAALAACTTHGGGGSSPLPTPSGGLTGLAYVANVTSSRVTVYGPLQSSPRLTIATGVSSPYAVAVSPSGTLFVDNCTACNPSGGTGQSITEYAAGSTAPNLTVTAGLDEPGAIAVDSSSNLYVANLANSTVTIYPSGKTSPSMTLRTAIDSPAAIAVDTSGNIYVGNEPTAGGSVTVYNSAGALQRTIPAPGIEEIALDSSANLYVSSCVSSCGLGSAPDSVTVYAANTANVKYRITSAVSVPTAMAFDGKGDLYVANDASGTIDAVREFGPGSTSPIATIDAPAPNAIAVDRNNIVYITGGASGSLATSTLTEYNGHSTFTVTNGINGAASVATNSTPAP